MNKLDKYFVILTVLILCALGFTGILYWLGIFNILDYNFKCSFHALTGYYCPGCGGTRSVYALLHGNIIESIKFHAFVPYTALGLFAFTAWNLIATIANHYKKELPFWHIKIRYIVIGIIILFSQCILKNILLICF